MEATITAPVTFKMWYLSSFDWFINRLGDRVTKKNPDPWKNDRPRASEERCRSEIPGQRRWYISNVVWVFFLPLIKLQIKFLYYYVVSKNLSVIRSEMCLCNRNTWKLYVVNLSDYVFSQNRPGHNLLTTVYVSYLDISKRKLVLIFHFIDGHLYNIMFHFVYPNDGTSSVC